jgi:hypothetical protein
MAMRNAWLALSCGLLWACAEGATEGDRPDDDGGGGFVGDGGGGAATTSTTSSGAGPSTGGGGSGGGGAGGPMCDPPEHLCGGICVGNTPQTGCYQSTTCTACPSVINGTTTCTAGGLCDFTCTSPYVKNGPSCSCPTQCCSNADCSGGATCDNGQCVEPCDQALCIFNCGLQNKVGVCQGNQCICL